MAKDNIASDVRVYTLGTDYQNGKLGEPGGDRMRIVYGHIASRKRDGGNCRLIDRAIAFQQSDKNFLKFLDNTLKTQGHHGVSPDDFFRSDIEFEQLNYGYLTYKKSYNYCGLDGSDNLSTGAKAQALIGYLKEERTVLDIVTEISDHKFYAQRFVDRLSEDTSTKGFFDPEYWAMAPDVLEKMIESDLFDAHRENGKDIIASANECLRQAKEIHNTNHKAPSLNMVKQYIPVKVEKIELRDMSVLDKFDAKEEQLNAQIKTEVSDAIASGKASSILKIAEDAINLLDKMSADIRNHALKRSERTEHFTNFLGELRKYTTHPYDKDFDEMGQLQTSWLGKIVPSLTSTEQRQVAMMDKILEQINGNMDSIKTLSDSFNRIVSFERNYAANEIEYYESMEQRFKNIAKILGQYGSNLFMAESDIEHASPAINVRQNDIKSAKKTAQDISYAISEMIESAIQIGGKVSETYQKANRAFTTFTGNISQAVQFKQAAIAENHAENIDPGLAAQQYFAVKTELLKTTLALKNDLYEQRKVLSPSRVYESPHTPEPAEALRN